MRGSGITSSIIDYAESGRSLTILIQRRGETRFFLARMLE